MAYIENIVIGESLVNPVELFAADINDWNNFEKEKTYYTNERFLPRILVDLGLYKSVSEIRKNKPELVIELNSIDFIYKLKVKKKQWLWFLIGR